MKNHLDIRVLVKEYVCTVLAENLSSSLLFHNIEHTKEVVRAVIEIAEHCSLSDNQLEIVIISAWFHDCGYTTTYFNHEDSSKSIASAFLRQFNYPQEKINKVTDCIEATRFPQNPKSIEEQILSDADLYHFTKPDYPKYEKALKEEFKICLGKDCTNTEWDKTNYNLLSNHTYFTEYGKNVLQKFKEINIDRIKQKYM